MKAFHIKILLTVVSVIALLAVGFIISVSQIPDTALGSVMRGGEYQGTTTVAATFLPETLLQTGVGTLGSVVVTGTTNGGVINLYDATTSNINLRTGNTPTSTIWLASFPGPMATGTYTFDRVFFNGLYVSILGPIPTTTITFRQ